MTDVDANDFVQWMVVGIPPTINNLDPANLPRGARVSQNSAGTSDYKGPCPTSGRHTYFITLYALRTESRITFSTPAAEALATINAAQTENVSVSGSVDS
jgi:phosphatidylethanolamine-binding protein (PEBP) family uncharacterized protein